MMKRDQKRKNRKPLFCLPAAVLLLAAVMVLQAYAESPEFSRSKEEWAKLRDDTLEWEEIPDLIEEYNATVKANQAAYSEDELREKNAQQTSDKLLQMAENYENMAAAAEGTSGGAITAASYRVMADQLRDRAEQNVSDYRVILLEYEREKMQTVRTARELFIAYHKAAAAKEQNAASVKYLQKAWQSAKNLQKNGMGTEIETLTALENLQKAQAEAVTKDSEINTCYRKLITMCGWAYDADPVIGPLPSQTEAAVLPADRNADQQTALTNSLTLKEDAIRLENAKSLYGSTVVKKWTDQTAADTNTVKSAFNSAYDSLKLAKDSYESALAQLKVQETGLAKAKKQLELGSIAQAEYAQSENKTENARAAKENAWMDLLAKKAAYEAVLNGLS